MVTHAAHLGHIFNVLDFTDDMKVYLQDTNAIRMVGHLTTMKEDAVKALVEGDGSPMMSVDTIELWKFQSWLEDWTSQGNNINTIKQVLMEDYWDSYQPMVQCQGHAVGG